MNGGTKQVNKLFVLKHNEVKRILCDFAMRKSIEQKTKLAV